MQTRFPGEIMSARFTGHESRHNIDQMQMEAEIGRVKPIGGAAWSVPA
jgi:hypothetical protein